MHFLYMGIMENADPHPPGTFEVTLRGETAIQAWTRRSKTTEKASADRRHDRYQTPFAQHG
jgi:hypothetical protein